MAEHQPTSLPDVASEDLFCLVCGYNQRGIVSDRCPECGQLHADLPPSTVRIPWFHRRHLGRLRAYWRTVRWVTFRPAELLNEMQCPPGYTHARRFWLMTIAHAFLPLLIGTVLLFLWLSPTDREYSVLFTPFYAPIYPAFAINLGLLLFFAMATGLPSYLCHPKRLPVEWQNRAVALSYYAAAPLALMPLLIGLIILAVALVDRVPGAPGFVAGLAVLLALLMLVVWYVQTVRIVAALARRRKFWLALQLGALWLAIAVLALLVTPALLHYAALMVYLML